MDRPGFDELLDGMMLAHNSDNGPPPRGLYRAAGALVVQLGEVPREVNSVVADLIAAWDADVPPDADHLASRRASLWRYLSTKNGNSTTIADRIDRTLRAALVLGFPEPDDYEDSAAWVAQMLCAESWPDT